jgi:hypothetical protein
MLAIAYTCTNQISVKLVCGGNELKGLACQSTKAAHAARFFVARLRLCGGITCGDRFSGIVESKPSRFALLVGAFTSLKLRFARSAPTKNPAVAGFLVCFAEEEGLRNVIPLWGSVKSKSNQGLASLTFYSRQILAQAKHLARPCHK